MSDQDNDNFVYRSEWVYKFVKALFILGFLPCPCPEKDFKITGGGRGQRRKMRCGPERPPSAQWGRREVVVQAATIAPLPFQRDRDSAFYTGSPKGERLKRGSSPVPVREKGSTSRGR